MWPGGGVFFLARFRFARFPPGNPVASRLHFIVVLRLATLRALHRHVRPSIWPYGTRYCWVLGNGTGAFSIGLLGDGMQWHLPLPGMRTAGTGVWLWGAIVRVPDTA